VLHTVVFFALWIVCRRLIAKFLPGFRYGAIVLAVSLAVLAIADELGQGLNPAREVELKDFVAGMSGLTLGMVATSPWQKALPGMIASATALSAAGYVTLDSFRSQVHVNAARELERAGDFLGARREYRLAFDAGVRSAGLFNELSWVEVESGVGDPQAAVAFGAKALAMRPDNPDYLDTYGWALHHAGRSAEALPFLERAYAAKPDLFCIHYHLGEVYVSLARVEEAMFHFRKQTELRSTREAARAAIALKRLDAELRTPRSKVAAAERRDG
jgi:tetratricopeptide (TPR) repeat protein